MFIWHMEQVLSIYERPYDCRYPVLCFDQYFVKNSLDYFVSEGGRFLSHSCEYGEERQFFHSFNRKAVNIKHAIKRELRFQLVYKTF